MNDNIFYFIPFLSFYLAFVLLIYMPLHKLMGKYTFITLLATTIIFTVAVISSIA